MDVFAQRLAELRKRRSMTQRQIAEFIGLSERMLRFYESGSKQPTLDVLIRLANVLDTSIDYLAGLTDDPTPPRRNSSSERDP